MLGTTPPRPRTGTTMMNLLLSAVLALSGLAAAPGVAMAAGEPAFTGDWEGAFRCSWGYTNASLSISGQSGAAYEAVLTHTPGIKTRSGTAPDRGVLQFSGKLSADGRSIEFTRVKRLEGRAPHWGVKSFAVHDDGAGGLTGGVTDGGGCTEMRLLRPGAAEQIAAGSPIVGTWYGSTVCGTSRKPVEGEFDLQVAVQSNGQYEAELVLGFPSSLSSGTAAMRYVGEAADASGDTFTFVAVKSVRGGVGIPDPGDFTLDAATGTGTFSSGKCSTFSGAPVADGAPRLTPTASVASGSGIFDRASGNREKCEVVISWTDRLGVEYPKIDFYRTANSARHAWRSIKLFADDDFVPVFGTAYDLMPHERRVEIARFIEKECYRDPFTKSRMENYKAAAQRIFGGSPVKQLTSNGYSSTLFAVRKIRTTRHLLSAIANPAAKSAYASFADAEAQMNAVRDFLEANPDLLWPSETASAEAAIEAFLSGFGSSEADMFLAQLEAEPSSQKVIAEIASVDTGKMAFVDQLSGSARSSFDARLAELKAAASEALVQPLLADARGAPDGLDGVEAVHRRIRGLAAMDGLDSAVRETTATVLADERTRRLSGLIDPLLAELAAYPDGEAGLARSRDWHEAFEGSFAAYADDPAVTLAQAAFAEDRSNRLRNSLDEFVAAAKALPPGDDKARNALLDRYLSMPSDTTNPSSMDYLFALENPNSF